MLAQLYIENIAVIEKASIYFNEGFTVVTGETGAGKSIIVDSINAILGNRVSKEIVRSGTEAALIIASFENITLEVRQKLNNININTDDNALIIQRKIKKDGKSSCHINNRPVTLSCLREIGSQLININGQNESFELLNTNKHVYYLDSIGDYEEKLNNYKKIYDDLILVDSQLKKLFMDDSQKLRELDLLKYQINELEEANFKVGEVEELEKQRNIMLNSEKISLALNEIYAVLNGNDEIPGCLHSLKAALPQLSNATKHLESLKNIDERIDSALCELEDCTQDIKNTKDEIQYDQNKLDEIEQRLDEFSKLARKYGNSVQQQLDFLEKSKNRLSDIELCDEKIEKLSTKLDELTKQAEKLSLDISEERKITAEKFCQRVKNELVFLDMPKVDFKIKQERCKLNSLGCDDISFEISVNPGESPKPLSKVASGGELSRVMLAIKTVLASNSKENSSLIFDEVDSGISGSTSEKVGLKLKELSAKRQVMCVTHSAQIASLADEHFLITKYMDEFSTSTVVNKLDFEGRKKELARIMSGVNITETSLKNAEEMLHNTQLK